MAEAAKKTAAKKQAPRRRETTPLDLESLPEPQDAPPVKHTRQHDSKAIKWLEDSRDREIAKQITVKKAQAKRLESMVRRAAKTLEIGVAVKVVEKGDEATVHFQAKKKRNYTKKKAASSGG